MEPTAQHLGVPQLQRNDIYAVPLEDLDQHLLVSISHDQIRTDAEDIHVDPLAADAL